MGFSENYLALRNKKRQQEQEQNVPAGGGSFSDNYLAMREQRLNQAPAVSETDNILRRTAEEMYLQHVDDSLPLRSTPINISVPSAPVRDTTAVNTYVQQPSLPARGSAARTSAQPTNSLDSLVQSAAKPFTPYFSEEYGENLRKNLASAEQDLYQSGGKRLYDETAQKAKARLEQWEADKFNNDQQRELSKLEKFDAEALALLDDYNGYVPALDFRSGVEKAQGADVARRGKAYRALRDKGYSDREIKQLAEYREVQRNAENAAIENAAYSYAAQEHPVIMSGVSVAQTPVKALGNIEAVRGVLPEKLGGYVSPYRPTDVNSEWYRFNRGQQSIRQTVRENIDNPVAQFLYDAGMSALDSAVNMVISSGIAGGLGLTGEALNSFAANTMSFVMGSQVAADTVMEELEKGHSNEEALALGIIRAVVEGITEKYSVENILREPNSVVGGLVKAFASEGTEEVASNWLNRVIDVLAEGSNSELAQLIAEYESKGYDAVSAKWLAIIGEDAKSFLAGGISGEMMSGAAEATNAARQYYYGTRLRTNERGTEINANGESVTIPETDAALIGLIESGLESEAGTESRQRAEEALEKVQEGKNVGAWERSQLAIANEEAIKNEPEISPETQAILEQTAAEMESEPAEEAQAEDVVENEVIPDEEETSTPEAQQPQQQAQTASPEENAQRLGIGAEGQKVYAQLVSVNADTDIGAFVPYWNAGYEGRPFESVTTNQTGLSEDAQRMAYNAGVADAAAAGENVAHKSQTEYNETENIISDNNTAQKTDTEKSEFSVLKTPFSKQAERYFKKANRMYIQGYNDQTFVGDGKVMLAVTDKEGLRYAETAKAAGYRADAIPVERTAEQRVGEMIDDVLRGKLTISDRPYSGKLDNIDVLIFDTPGGQLVVNMQLFNLIDGGTLYYDLDKKMIVATDESGKVSGFMLGIKTDNFNLSTLKQVNIKSLKKTKAAIEQEVSGNGEEVAEVSDGGRVSESSVRGQSDGGLLDGLASEDVQETAGRGNESGGVLRPEGERVRGHADRTDAAGNGGGRSLGDSEGVHLSAAGEVEEIGTSGAQEENRDRAGSSAEVETEAEESTASEEIETKSEQAVQENPRGSNFVIPAKGLSLPNGEKARYKANIQAIKTLRKIMAEGRFATPEEQVILSKYVGWGGLANAFDERKEDWAKEYKELKSLLTEAEYKAARGSTLNAHYTDIGVIRGIYAGLEKLGFNGGRLLEPSAGIGHFAGAMPEGLLPNVQSWTMVELDSITGNIAKYLYPNADVRVQGFETAKIPDNYMDMAISNVPFGNYGIADKSYPREVTSAIHNYFFAKSLDKVRPGGIVAFITSRYTMDAQDSAVRRYIMKRADLLGAIRLPDTAFKGNAGTEVVTDIIILKKREAGTPYKGEAFENTDYYYRAAGIYEQTNEYFQNHPEMVLGEPSKTGSMYRSASLTYTAKDTKLSLQKQIEKAFDNITGKMDYPVRQTAEQVREAVRKAQTGGKHGSIVKQDGKLYKIENGELQEAKFSKNEAAKIEAVIGIRDSARALLDAQISGKSESEIAEARKKLNSLYDEFVKANGPLHKLTNARLIKKDSDSPFILALENYDKDKGTATKAAIFTKNTVSPNVTVTHVNTVEDGLAVVMNEIGMVDTARIAQLTGETEEAVRSRLLETGLVYMNRDGNLETAEQYLSGNVKAKLRDAEALAESNPEYQRNVEALKKIIPQDIAPEDISVRPGVTWVPTAYYSEFAAEMLGTTNRGYRPAVQVKYNAQLNQYDVVLNDRWLKTRPENISTWGTPDRSFVNILTATLNNRNITVWRKTEDGGRILDKQATAAAQEKQEKILAEFQKWIWQDETRKTELAKLYNDIFNNSVIPHYDGSRFVVNGANAEKPLRPHQADAVQRMVYGGGNTLLAHRVGAGKTYEMAAAAMKLRQLGIVKKPVFVVPKSLVAQWANEFYDFFPAAKVLALEDNAFSTANRKEFANRIATGDFDAVIMSQEQFKAIPMSPENQEAFYQQQIDELEEAILETAAQNGKRDPSIKQMERSKKSLEAKLRKIGDMKKDADNIDFESMGIDALFVDEAHSYKNLFYTTNMSNISGLGSKEGSQKAFDLYMKVRYLQRLNGGRGIVFATATPVMNSMSEMYIMQKYLQGDLLDARGLTSFDAWANQFGEVRTVLEMNPSGKGFRQKQSFSRFKNLAELQQMFRAFADVVTEIPGLKIPTMKTGKRIIVESEPSDFQMSYIDQLAVRADAIKNGKVDPREDNMLKITSEGRKLSYTQRMLDPSLPYEEDNKITKCAQNVYDIWKETADIKGTQLIFCDLSTPKGGTSTSENTEADTEAVEAEDISIYDDIKNMLIGQGIPANEIAFIHEANTNDKKAKLFDDVNEGRVRVLIGSTGKMGVGMNAQKRVAALHHLDAPWRPGDIEQREGRALRQGNMNDEVGVYVYVTKKTFDSRMWDNLQRKASFIHQVMAGDLTARESEGDGDFALSAAEIKAISSGNPLIMEQFEVAAELAKLESLERAHNKEIADARQRIQKNNAQIISDEDYAEKLRKDLSNRQDTTGDKFNITVGGKKLTERKAAGEAIIAQAKKYLKINREAEETTKIGSFAGFDLLVTNGGDLLLKGAAQYRTAVNMQSAVGTVQSLEAMAKRIDALLAATETRIEENKSAVTKLEKTIAAPFERADELAAARIRNAEIMAELNPDENSAAGFDEDEGEDVEYSVDTSSEPETSYSRDGGISPHPEQWRTQRVGDSNKKPMSLSEIVEKIRHDFEINITTGHVRGAGVRGQYNRKEEGIRSRIANDIITISHELGHHFDNMYGITDEKLPDEVKRELIDNLDPEFAEQYKKKALPGEGVAEFLRHFLTNSETAKIDYPKMTEYFLNTLSGPDAALIEELADEINAYLSLDVNDAQSSLRLREEKLPDARTAGEKIKAKANVLYQAWVDTNHGIKRLDESIGSNVYKIATNAAYADARAGAAIVGDLYDVRGAYVGHGLKSCFAGNEKYLTDKKLYRVLGEYLVVTHGPERLAEGMRIFADDRKNSTAWMLKRQQELEQQYPELAEIAENLYDFQEQFLQTWGVETGLVSEESAEEWAARWKYYVPLNRAVSEEQRGIGAKRGFANQNSTIKKAIGSGLDIIHPVDNIVSNMVKMINAGIRNDVMRRMTVAAQNSGDANFLEKVPMPVKKKTVSTADLKKELSEAGDQALLTGLFNENASLAFEMIIDNIDDILEQYGRGKAYGDVVTVMKNGKPEYWKINDPQLLQSITNMAPKKMEGILDAYAQVSRFITSNITGKNLLWSIFSNAPRDMMTFFTYSKERNPVKVFAAMGSAYANKVKGDHADALYKEYLAMGGGSVSAYTADRDLAKRAREKLAGKNISANPLDWIAWTSDLIEMGPRFATYKLMRNNGMSAEEAFYEAMDITVNFRRGGRISREINKVVPFFNAGVQGLDKFARWISAQDAPVDMRPKVVRGRVAAWVAASAIMAAITYGLNNGDDDKEKDYERLSNYTKNSYWSFPLGDGKFFAVPKPRELGVLSSLFETCMEYGIGKNDHAFDEFYKYAVDTSLPSILADVAQGDFYGAIVGDVGIIGVVGYLMANRDFRGKPIEPSGMQHFEAKDKYNERTSKIAVAVGNALNLSPMKIDYFFEQTLGGYWKAQKALFPVGSENVDLTLGIQGQYIKDSQYSTDLVNRLYNQAKKTEAAKNSHPEDADKALEAKLDSNMTTFYSRYLKVSKNSNGTAARGTRSVVLEMILEYEKATESGYLTPAEKAVYDIAKASDDVGTYLPSVVQITVKDGNGAEHILSDVQYVEYQTDYNRIFWEAVEDSLSVAQTDAERRAIIKGAKTTASQRAKERVLKRIGAPVNAPAKEKEESTSSWKSSASWKSSSADTEKGKYDGVDNITLTTWQALIDIANDDGGLKQEEVIDVLERMQADKTIKLSDEDAYTLFHSKYSSDKNNPWAKRAW